MKAAHVFKKLSIAKQGPARTGLVANSVHEKTDQEMGKYKIQNNLCSILYLLNIVQLSTKCEKMFYF